MYLIYNYTKQTHIKEQIFILKLEPESILAELTYK